MSQGPLDGLVVIDLSRALAGPHAAMMLGDMGARVIKVESRTGDDTRGWGPPFVGPLEAEESTYFLSCNRNKESITLDLKTSDGTRTLRRLLLHGDVVVENFRTGVLDRLGFSVEEMLEINPRLVILSITGFGHDGPEGGRAGYDQIAQGEAGLMSLTGPDGDHPIRVGVPIGDLLAGMYGAWGVACALLEREQTGRGQVVRTSLLAAIVGVHAFQGTRWTVAHEVPRANGNHHSSICPYGLFPCADGHIQIAVGSEGLWKVFAQAFGLPASEEGFATNSDRVKNAAAVTSAVEDAFAAYPASELLEKLEALGIPAGRVRSLDEVYQWEQTISQGLILEVDHPTLGKISLPGPPVRMGSGGRTRHHPPPRLGEHDRSVRSWLDAMDTDTKVTGRASETRD